MTRDELLAVAAAQAKVLSTGAMQAEQHERAAGKHVHAWRSVGVEAVIVRAGLDAEAKAALDEALRSLAPQRLAFNFPRETDGRLPVNARVLLAALPPVPRPPQLKQAFLVAASPAGRRAPQVLTLGVEVVVGAWQRHRWTAARWLWSTDEEAPREPAPAATIRSVVALLERGEWRRGCEEAGVTVAIDEPLPYAQANFTAGVEPSRWDEAIAREIGESAPWRFAALVERGATGRLFTLPGQRHTVKYAVVLAPGPVLLLEATGSEQRIPEVEWKRSLASELRRFKLRASPQELAGAPAPAADEEIDEEPARARPRSSSQATEAELLEAIGVAPDDDGPRLVYADFIDEQGDAPRARFIHLQIQRSLEGGARAGAEEKEIEAQHGLRWLSRILPVLEEWRFHRGFLDRCALSQANPAATAIAAGHPLWTTVREVTGGVTPATLPLLLHPVMRALRVVRGAPAAVLGSEVGIETLQVTAGREILKALTQLRLPNLRRLEVNLSPKEAAPILGGLERAGLTLVSAIGASDLKGWCQLLLDAPPRKLQVRLTMSGIELTPRGRQLGVRVGDVALKQPDVLARLGAAFGVVNPLVGHNPFPRGLLEAVDVEAAPKVLANQAAATALASLEAACGEIGIRFRAGRAS